MTESYKLSYAELTKQLERVTREISRLEKGPQRSDQIARYIKVFFMSIVLLPTLVIVVTSIFGNGFILTDVVLYIILLASLVFAYFGSALQVLQIEYEESLKRYRSIYSSYKKELEAMEKQ